MLACRALDLTESCGTAIDALIGLKFPAYYIEHPRKVLWVLHQYREAYDLWGHEFSGLHRYPTGIAVRDAIEQADRTLLPRARAVFANSGNVSKRLKRYCGIDSEPLYHPPPHSESFRCSEPQPYFFFPSRINRMKRQDLVVQALARTRNPVRVRFCGSADDVAYADGLQPLCQQLGVARRIEWLGSVSEQEKIAQYAGSLAVIYPPIDEDYGYVTLEAMLSSKAVVTCSDSGGTLEFVVSGETGLVTDANAESLAAALDQLWDNQTRTRQMGRASRERYDSLGINWKHVIERLLSCV